MGISYPSPNIDSQVAEKVRFTKGLEIIVRWGRRNMVKGNSVQGFQRRYGHRWLL